MISVEIHELAFFADKAFEEKDEDTLKKIALTGLESSQRDKYNPLEKAILSYHGDKGGVNVEKEYIWRNFTRSYPLTLLLLNKGFSNRAHFCR